MITLFGKILVDESLLRVKWGQRGAGRKFLYISLLPMTFAFPKNSTADAWFVFIGIPRSDNVL